MLNSSDLDRVHRRAVAKQQQASQQQQRSATAPSGDQLTPWTGLKKVTFNYLPPSAAHQPMKYQPFDQ
jgi:hypothetical protein